MTHIYILLHLVMDRGRLIETLFDEDARVVAVEGEAPNVDCLRLNGRTNLD